MSKKWSISALLCAVILFSGMTSVYANVTVNTYLNFGEFSKVGDNRAYEAGEKIAVSYSSSSSSNHTATVQVISNSTLIKSVNVSPGTSGRFDFYAPHTGYYFNYIYCNGATSNDCSVNVSMDDYYN